MLRNLSIALSFVAVAVAHKEKKYVAPRKSCPKGFSLSGKECIGRRYEAEQLFCQGDATLNGDSCTTYYPLEKSCPEGWSLTGKSCSQTTSAPRTAVCYNGYTLEGDYCMKVNQVPLVATCSEGYLEGNMCLVHEEEDADFACPSNAEYEKGQCYTTETYDCTTKKSTYGRWLGKRKNVRPAYYSSNKFSKKAHYKAPVPTRTWCTRRVPQALVSVCPQGWINEDGACARTLTRLPKMICPLGGGSKDCTESDIQEADYRCPAGFRESKSGCYATQTTHADWNCPNYCQQYGDRCATHSTPSRRCAHGVSDGKGKCVIVETSEPIVTYGKY